MSFNAVSPSFLKTNCQLIFIVGIRGDLPSLWSFSRHSTVPPAEAQGCLECRYVCRTFRRSSITVCRNVTLLCQTVRAKMAPKLWDVLSCGGKKNTFTILEIFISPHEIYNRIANVANVFFYSDRNSSSPPRRNHY